MIQINEVYIVNFRKSVNHTKRKKNQKFQSLYSLINQFTEQRYCVKEDKNKNCRQTVKMHEKNIYALMAWVVNGSMSKDQIHNDQILLSSNCKNYD